MARFSLEEIRRRFAGSNDFNEIFDAFEDAVQEKLDDIELYRLLFWNHSLTPDELCLFGEKLGKEFPNLAYDIYRWLASVFAVTYSAYDNYELALKYYKKASFASPAELEPYIDACDCYEPDLNIPPVDALIEFLRYGCEYVPKPKLLYSKLAYFFGLLGNTDESERYRQKADEPDPPEPPPDDPVLPLPSDQDA